VLLFLIVSFLEPFSGRLYTGYLGIYTYVKIIQEVLVFIILLSHLHSKNRKYIEKSVCMAAKHDLLFWGNTRDKKCEVKDVIVL
jgi:hypothetical protein